METTTAAPDAIRVYWMTGCSSCLRTKEFLQKNGIPFLSRNVLDDETAFDELARFGLKQVPIVTRGDAWANGQVLRDVAKLCGIPYGEVRLLPVAEMRARLDASPSGKPSLPRSTAANTISTGRTGSDNTASVARIRI